MVRFPTGICFPLPGDNIFTPAVEATTFVALDLSVFSATANVCALALFSVCGLVALDFSVFSATANVCDLALFSVCGLELSYVVNLTLDGMKPCPYIH